MSSDRTPPPLPPALAAVAWPRARLGEAVHRLAVAAGFAAAPSRLTPLGAARHDAAAIGGPTAASPPAVDRWLAATAPGQGVEITPTDAADDELESFLAAGGPALVHLPGSDGAVLAMVAGGRRRLTCIAPSGGLVALDRDLVLARIAPAHVRRDDPALARVLAEAGLPPGRRVAALAALAELGRAQRAARVGWLVRPAADAPVAAHARDARLWVPALGAIAAQVTAQALVITSWFTIGAVSLTGRFEWGWIDAWTLLLVCLPPVQALALRCEGVLNLRLGALFKRRLLVGVLRLSPEEVRSRGAGQFMGMAMEADVLELVSLAGVLVTLVSVVRLAAALVMLAIGSGGVVAAVFLLAWLVAAVLTGRAVWRRAEAWAVGYRDLTNDLVERMTGHRTRLAQEDPERWHDREDALLARYWHAGRALDRMVWPVQGGLARGWMALGLIGLAVPLALGTVDQVALAFAVLGVLFAYQAFVLIGHVVPNLVQLVVAWRELTPLVAAARRAEDAGADPAAADRAAAAADHDATPALEAAHVSYSYPGRTRDVLADCALTLAPRARLLLEGPSGGGKSTLAAVLSGLREPTGGLVLLHGVDAAALGVRAWRRRVVAVPQFHENHVLAGTFAFNLLIGRGWPPTRDDLKAAQAVCQALDLGPLLARMPAGFQQTVGDSGWQLSHGERSRLFIARALLQDPAVMILDESFGALDPETLADALTTVLDRAPALIVIAHP